MSCLTPFTVRDKLTNRSIPVPCGKCPECLKRRVSAWSFRLMQEDKRSTSSHFVTLTYDTAHVPISKNGYMSVSMTDVQNFMKRLRKLVILDKDQLPLKYYVCAEYGGKTNRPHYHMIIFNLPSAGLIDKCWQLGSVHYGQVTGASVGYTLKYINKQKRIPQHKHDDRVPEFRKYVETFGSRVSNRAGYPLPQG